MVVDVIDEELVLSRDLNELIEGKSQLGFKFEFEGKLKGIDEVGEAVGEVEAEGVFRNWRIAVVLFL